MRGLFADLRRYLERAWTQYAGTDPYAGDVWRVQLLDLQSNGSRRWPATKGTVDFGCIELHWLREVIKDWARNTRPYLQRLRQALRACRVASQTLVACGRADPTSLGAGDFVLVERAIVEQRRTDGSAHSASYRTQLLRVFCEVIEHGRANALLTEVPDPFRPAPRRHRAVEDVNEEQLGKALPDNVIRQLDRNLHLLGPTSGHGSISAVDLRAMHQTIYQILRDTGRPTASPAAHHRRHRRDHHDLAASPRANAHRPGNPAVAVPLPATALPPGPRPPDRQLRRGGVSPLDAGDPEHHQRTPGPQRGPAAV